MRRIADYREKYHSTFGNLLPEQEMSSFVDNDVVNVLVNRDQHGRRILLMKLGGSWDPSKVTNDQLVRCLYLIHLGAILEPETQVHGIVIIIDLKDMGMTQVGAVTPTFAFKLISFIQDAMPLRFKGLHIVNNPFVWNIAWNILKPLQNQKVRERVCFNSFLIYILRLRDIPLYSHIPIRTIWRLYISLSIRTVYRRISVVIWRN